MSPSPQAPLTPTTSAPAPLHLDRVDGVLGTLPETFGGPDDREDVPCVPPLPLGHQAHPAWGFHDPTGRCFYEFNRVYGPPERSGDRRPTSRLDRNLSYWGVTWRTSNASGEERAAGRWMSYAQARALRGSRLTFERFSSPIRIRAELPELLRSVAGADG